MSLTELQMPEKINFYRKIQAVASELNALIKKLKDLSEFVGRTDVTDLDTMGVPAGAVRTDLLNFRTMLNEIVSMMEGNPVTPTNPPEDVIEKLRGM